MSGDLPAPTGARRVRRRAIDHVFLERGCSAALVSDHFPGKADQRVELSDPHVTPQTDTFRALAATQAISTAIGPTKWPVGWTHLRTARGLTADFLRADAQSIIFADLGQDAPGQQIRGGNRWAPRDSNPQPTD